MENKSSYKGAVGPGSPPPQNTNPIRYLEALILIGIILIIICLILSSFIYQGALYFQLLISAFCAGITTATIEWMYEVYALVKDNWFNYDFGHYKIGGINLHMPVEINITFLVINPSLIYLSFIPNLLRAWGTNVWPFYDPNLDLVLYVPMMLVIVSIFGALNDYTSSQYFGVVKLTGYNYWKLLLLTWIPCCTLGVVVGRILMIPLISGISFAIAVLILFLILIISITFFAVLFMRKHRDILKK